MPRGRRHGAWRDLDDLVDLALVLALAARVSLLRVQSGARAR